ncbi:hypothetical protein CERSUDRAFT_76914 [Gelatoporia subvermispora B]|uniref:Uncharacterized protein n=1 Tax=Ceriporiopsis subvermispora (strain B) TaxID=914234 RepID=M2QM44_CERS8|nr:hypothetical protein CERSUDRAFT_76914 [Gelatoporia subvermispora B]
MVINKLRSRPSSQTYQRDCTFVQCEIAVGILLIEAHSGNGTPGRGERWNRRPGTKVFGGELGLRDSLASRYGRKKDRPIEARARHERYSFPVMLKQVGCPVRDGGLGIRDASQEFVMGGEVVTYRHYWHSRASQYYGVSLSRRDPSVGRSCVIPRQISQRCRRRDDSRNRDCDYHRKHVSSRVELRLLSFKLEPFLRGDGVNEDLGRHKRSSARRRERQSHNTERPRGRILPQFSHNSLSATMVITLCQLAVGVCGQPVCAWWHGASTYEDELRHRLAMKRTHMRDIVALETSKKGFPDPETNLLTVFQRRQLNRRPGTQAFGGELGLRDSLASRDGRARDRPLEACAFAGTTDAVARLTHALLQLGGNHTVHTG